MAKLLDLIRELKSQGKTAEEIAKELGKPIFLIRAIYNLA